MTNFLNTHPSDASASNYYGAYGRKPSMSKRKRPPRGPSKNNPFGLNGFLKPLTPQQLLAQARKQVSSQVDPQMALIRQEYAKRLKLQSNNISVLTGRLMGEQSHLAQAIPGYFNNASSNIAAIGGALGQSAVNTGNQAQTNLSSQLAQIQAPGASSQVAANAAAQGVNSADLIHANNAADMDNMALQGSAGATFGQSLPMIAQLAAVRSQRILQEQLNSQQGDAIKQLEATIPGMIQQVYQNLYQNEFQKLAARMGLLPNGGAAQNIKVGDSIYRVNPDGSTTRIAHNPAAAKAPPGATYTDPVTGVHYDKYGHPVYVTSPTSKPPGTNAKPPQSAQQWRQRSANYEAAAAKFYAQGPNDVSNTFPGSPHWVPPAEAFDRLLSRVRADGWGKVFSPAELVSRVVQLMRAAGYRDFSFLGQGTTGKKKKKKKKTQTQTSDPLAGAPAPPGQ